MSTGTVTDTMTVAKRLVELCREGQHMQAIDELYADDCVSVEVMAGFDGSPRVTEGKAAIVAKSEKFYEMMEVHGGEVGDPHPHDDRFICTMAIDVTSKVGPMAGQRIMMNEACLYTVKDGKIVREEFFYDTGDCEG